MDFNRLTHRSRQAMEGALALAQSGGHQTVEPDHLLLALLGHTDGLVYPLLTKLEIQPTALRNALESNLAQLPKVYGGSELALGPESLSILEAADQIREEFKDDYLSVEHLLLAFVDSAADAGEALRGLGATRQAILAALTEIRGSQRVTTPDPEATFDALEQYGRDITTLARQEKLDPVIGRDDEIRRLIQVLSRRTKNNP
ncbi:MAG: Clp protease N-terminal domain-containing protein, partial [Acidimicrobiia bacterium]